MPRKAATKATFEESLSQLETIVSNMEESSLPLEDLLSNYEEGHELLQQCQTMVENARKRIEVVQLNRVAGETQSENKLASKTSAGETPASEDSPDDIRLL